MLPVVVVTSKAVTAPTVVSTENVPNIWPPSSNSTFSSFQFRIDAVAGPATAATPRAKALKRNVILIFMIPPSPFFVPRQTRSDNSRDDITEQCHFFLVMSFFLGQVRRLLGPAPAKSVIQMISGTSPVEGWTPHSQENQSAE